MGWTRVGSLGKGSYGFVSLGRSTSPSDGIGPKLPPLFAIKSAPHTDSETLEFERGLFHELRDCPEIIGCYGADASLEDNVILYNLFLEYASGGCLKDRICSGKPLSEDEIKNYTRSILLGIRHIHRRGIIHCDLKPANILLVYGGNGSYVAKISDLGLALREEDETDVEKLRGTPRYLAPESILHGDYGPGVDIWALGCIVAEMILRTPLRQFNRNRNPEMTLETMLEQMAKQEVEIPAGISADAHSFLTKCLDVNPRLRWGADKLLREHPFVSDSDSKEYDLELAVSDFEEGIHETNIEAATDHDASYTEEDLQLMLPMKLLERDRDEDALSDDQYDSADFHETVNDSGEDFHQTISDSWEDFHETNIGAATEPDASYTEEDLRLMLPMKLLQRDRDEDALSDDQYDSEDFHKAVYDSREDFHQTISDSWEDFHETNISAATELDASYTEEELHLMMPVKLLKRDRDEDALSEDQYPAFYKKQRLFSPCC